MTEVPEHLLARSKQARAKAAGGGGGDEGAPPATPGEAPGTGAAASAVEPAGAPAATPAPVAEPPKPVPPYVAAAVARPKVPRFAIPVLAALPVWALIYAGTLTGGAGPADPELALGADVYASACSGCHGNAGQGGTGRPLGQVVETFPDRADHIAWVQNGSPEAGTPYGEGRISQQGFPAMPGFASSLSPEQIAAVVRYEREEFGGEEATPGGAEAEGGAASDAEGETEPSAGEGEDGGTSENEAESQGGDVGGGGENPESSPDAGTEGGGSGSDASPSGS